jgi:beta-lactamase class C
LDRSRPLIRLVAQALGMALVVPVEAARAEREAVLQRLVTHEVRAILPANGAGGAAVALRIKGRTLFFNYGWADRTKRTAITSDSLFNLGSIRKVFETTLLARAVGQGELSLDDPVAKYVIELEQGGDIGRLTIGQLAAHTSGLLLPHDHPPWPTDGYTFASFIGVLNAWKADKEQEPGQQHIYTHAGYVLLQLAQERRFAVPIGELIESRESKPLGMASATLPLRGRDGRAELPSGLMRRAVQGYSEDGEPIGKPGDQQTYYDWPGTGQMFSSARDMAVFLAANLGELTDHRPLQEAMQFAQQGVFAISPRNTQALGWEINFNGDPPIVEKNGGLNNSSTYIGMIPARKLGIVILANRGNQDPAEVGRRVMWKLASMGSATLHHSGVPRWSHTRAK